MKTNNWRNGLYKETISILDRLGLKTKEQVRKAILNRKIGPDVVIHGIGRYIYGPIGHKKLCERVGIKQHYCHYCGYPVRDL